MSDVINPRHPSTRTKAYRLRKRAEDGDLLTAEETAWLADYEAAQGSDVGASATERIINIEERSAAVGTGDAAREAAAMASIAREEGRRIDYLAKTGMAALVQACTMYQQMAASMLARTEALEEVHLGMLESVRQNYLARTQAEVDAIQAAKDAEGGQIGELVNALLPVIMQRLGGAAGIAAPTAAPKHRKR